MQDIQSLLKKPELYEDIDGSRELMLGCMVIGFMLFSWVGAHAPRYSICNNGYSLFIFFVLLEIVLIYGRKAIKHFITYPRTGFVSYQKPRLVSLALICILGASVSCVVGLLIAFFFVQGRGIDRTVLVTIGIGLLLTAAYARGFARAIRWKWATAAILLVFGIVIALLPVSLASAPVSQSWLPAALNQRLVGSLFWYEACYGVILLISGSISLALYLRNSRNAHAE